MAFLIQLLIILLVLIGVQFSKQGECLSKPTAMGMKSNNVTLDIEKDIYNSSDLTKGWKSTGIIAQQGVPFGVKLIDFINFTTENSYYVLALRNCALSPSSIVKVFNIPHSSFTKLPSIDSYNDYLDLYRYLNSLSTFTDAPSTINIPSNSMVIVQMDDLNSLFTSTGTWSEKQNKMILLNKAMFDSGVSINNASTIYAEALNNKQNQFCLTETSFIRGLYTDSSPCTEEDEFGFNSKFCYYNNASGLKFNLDDKTIKEENSNIQRLNSDLHLFAYNSDTTSNLNFVFDSCPISPTCNVDYITGINTSTPKTGLSYLNEGLYIFKVTVSDKSVTGNNKVHYAFKNDDTNLIEYGGILSSVELMMNSPASGEVYLSVERASSGTAGTIQLQAFSYGGTNIFSTSINNYVVQPVISKIEEMSAIIYGSFISNASVKNSVHTLLSLYIIFYMAYFLLGFNKRLTQKDFITRIGKIVLINVLFSENSWHFFNEYVFVFVTQGLFRLFDLVTFDTSNIGNPFAFLDPLIERSIDPYLWKGLAYMLMSGSYTIVALIGIYSIVSIFVCFFEVVANFIVSFLVICVLTALAPFFIIFCLFESTEKIFKAWINLLLMNSFQPLILVLYILSLDQIMSYFTAAIIPTLCWSRLIPLAFYFDFGWFHLPFGSISFSPEVIGLPNDWFSSYLPTGTNVFESLGNSLILLICAELTNKSVAFANEISAEIFGASSMSAIKEGEILPDNMAEDLVRKDLNKAGRTAFKLLAHKARE